MILKTIFIIFRFYRCNTYAKRMKYNKVYPAEQ